MEFKATKDIRGDVEFKRHSDEFDKYNECLSKSNDPLIKSMSQWMFVAHSKMWVILFEHLLTLDREIQRLNKELIFKDTP